MGTEFLCLLCLGLSLGYGEKEKDETFPRPSLSAWPSSVVGRKSNVTLRCWTHFYNITVMLRKLHDSGYRQEQSSAGNKAEFSLTDVQPKDAGQYFCAYKIAASSKWSEESHHVQLVVTGSLPEPSLSVNISTMTSGHRTLQCQIPYNGTECFVIALLKTGVPEPLQTKKVRKNQTDFMLWNVTSKDNGNYSCVHYQCHWPYLGSSPSRSLEIRVSDGHHGPGAPEQKTVTEKEAEREKEWAHQGLQLLQTNSRCVCHLVHLTYVGPGDLSLEPGSLGFTDSRLIFLSTFSCLCISLLFLSIFLIYRCTQHDSAHEEPPRRTSHSKFLPQEQETTD